MLDQVRDLLLAAAAFAGFAALFHLTWRLSARYGQHSFERFSDVDKAEWCSRACSNAHVCIVIPGVIACLLENSWSGEVRKAACVFLFGTRDG